ncbi:MAG: transglutaminase domain-containing protein [Lachnospiraceae bacterium]|nr:transglutaminase domain-containing protein [Lachnospiraceae bacterium]
MRKPASDAIARISLMLLGIMAMVLSFIECFEIECSKGMIFLFTITVLIILAGVMELKRQNLILIILAVLVLTGAILLRTYLKTGILSLANAILFQYQKYYDQVHAYSFRIDMEELRWNSLYWYNTIVICAIIIEYAYILMTATWNKIYAAVHYVFTVAILAIPMAFGLFPPPYVVVLIMVYCIMCLAFQHSERISLKKSGFLLVVTLFSAGMLFVCVNPDTYVEASRFSAIKSGFNSVVEKLDIDELFTNGIFGGRSSKVIAAGGLGKGELGKADKISFSGKVMLNATMPLPKQDVYLKGYAASYYDGDRWSYSYYNNEYNHFLTSYFNYYMSNNEFLNIGEAAEDIMSRPYKAVQELDSNLYTIRIKNLSGDNNCYIPYNALITQRQTIEDLMVSGHRFTYNVDVLLYEFYNFTLQDYADLYEEKIREWRGYLWTPFIPTDEADELYKDYAEETCLAVPDDLIRLFDELLPDAPSYDGESPEELLDCIEYVRSYLQKHTEYTLNPGRMEGKDFVKDFLVNKKKGYCTSYASATVLMLRYMGVPARYAEGYRIGFREIAVGSYDRGTGEYTFDVKDSSAHAWAEVYVHGIGFLPADTTPAVDSDVPAGVPLSSDNDTSSAPEELTTVPFESSMNNETTTAMEGDTRPETPAGGENSGLETGTGESGHEDLNSVAIVVILLLTVMICTISAFIYKYYNKKKSRKKELGAALRKLSPERQRMILLAEELFELLGTYGVCYDWGKYTEEFAAEMEELLRKAESLKQERKPEGNIPGEGIEAQEFLKQYQKAKFSEINQEIPKEDYKKFINYIDKCKNSLQYLKK